MEPIKKLFHSNFFLEIKKRKKHLELLQKEMAVFIPEELIPLVKIKNQIGKTIVVEVRSNVVAHKLKLYENQIIGAINRKSGQGELLSKIKVKMIIQNTKLNKVLISQSSYPLKQLKSLADSINDSPLKTALKKLIKSRNE
jgi:hypothetical protein|tara:strand:+ start:22 stop:444 length:423 start_codon:yes stop_codon:yes gene_type:complete